METLSRCRTCGVHDDVLTDDGQCTTCWCKAMDESEGITYRYYVTEGGFEQEVTKAEWVRAERRAGFYNTMGHPDEPGTGAFSTTRHGGLCGRKEAVKMVDNCTNVLHPREPHEHVGPDVYT